MASASTHRSTARSVSVTFRFAPEEREEIKDLARKAGMSVQQYAAMRLLGREVEERHPGRPRNVERDTELPYAM